MIDLFVFGDVVNLFINMDKRYGNFTFSISYEGFWYILSNFHINL